MLEKIVSAKDAIAIIQDGDTLCVSGLVGAGTPDELVIALEKRFLETDHPRNLWLVFAAGQGDGNNQGLNRLAHDGLLGRVVGGHYALVPKIGRLALEGRIECYNLPQGCLSHLFRDIAAGKPGTISHVGLGTFVDPRHGGGRVNDITPEDHVERIALAGKEYLFYRAFPLNVAFVRGTTADPSGNITAEREALILDNLAMAMAVKNSDGVVIAQVERIAKQGSLSSREVMIPGALVDCIVVAKPENHRQTYATRYSPVLSGEITVPLDNLPSMDLDARKVIARRCAFELPPNGVVNLGIGMPEGVAAIAAEENILDYITLTAESGVMGGVPTSGQDFGTAVNAEAVIQQNEQFDFYDGGGLDLACLGMAQCDQLGNVNVSRFGTKLAGAGGFINISQNARRVVFAGTFTTRGLDVAVEDGRLNILKEGRTRKFTRQVEQITFSGNRANAVGQPVLFVTERCVFRLGTGGLELTEVAPGVDVERDIFANMDFMPVAENPAPMDKRIFCAGKMELKSCLLDLTLVDRISYDEKRNTLFLNFQNLHVRDTEDVTAIRDALEARCELIGKRVDLVVNYGSFRLEEEVAADYRDMVGHMEDTHYNKVSRYSTSAFMRMKLGKMLIRTVAPHIFETREEARSFNESIESGPTK